MGEPQPLAVAKLVERTTQTIRATTAGLGQDGFLFAGNRHDSVPRILLTDDRLTPIERNAWQVFRMLLNENGITTFPTYEQLRPYLASTPCGGKASDETLARALTLLRLTRWLTLVRQQRDPATGRIRGNLYVLHDEPLTPYEAIQLDPHYLRLVNQSLTHASKTVQRVAHHTLKEVSEDSLANGRVLPTRIQTIAQRLSRRGWLAPPVDEDPAEPSHATALAPRRSTKEAANTTGISARLRLPEAFGMLKPEQQSAALAALQRVEANLHQAIIDEWNSRCRDPSVRKPVGYLFGIIQSALRGDFNALLHQHGRKPNR